MTMYSQSLVVFQYSHGNGADNVLTMAYGLARKGSDGFSIAGTGALSNITLVIPTCGITDAETWGGKGMFSQLRYDDPAKAREQLIKATKLFVLGNTVTISSTDYSVYARGSYMVERGRPNWQRYGKYGSGDTALTPP